MDPYQYLSGALGTVERHRWRAAVVPGIHSHIVKFLIENAKHSTYVLIIMKCMWA